MYVDCYCLMINVSTLDAYYLILNYSLAVYL